METLLLWLGIIAALVVVIEGFNKLERTDLRGLTGLRLVSALLRAGAWTCALLAACGLFFADALPSDYLHLGYTLAIVGFACMVIRSRVREYLPKQEPIAVDADGFERTQVLRRP